LDKSVCHVTAEECLLEKVIIIYTDMGKKVLSEDILGKLDSLIFGSHSLLSIGPIVDGGSHLRNIVEASLLGLILDSLFKTWSKCFGHVGITLVTQYHVEDLLVALTSQCSEKNNHRNIASNFWNSSIYFTAFFSLLDIELKLQSWFIIFLILGPYLGIPAVLTRWKLVIENQHDVASLTLLSDDYLLGTIDNEVSTLIIHALFLPNDSFVVLVIEMALGASYHDGDLAELDLLGLVLLNDLSGEVAVSLTFLDVDIHLGVDLVCHVPDSCFMGEVRVHGIGLGVFHHGLAAGVDLAEYNLVADVVILVICLSRDVLTGDFDHVVLVLLDAISNHVLDKPVEGLNLLVNYSILIEVSINDFPLIIHANLVFAIILNFWLRCWLAANR
jgi:hypothetical protein